MEKDKNNMKQNNRIRGYFTRSNRQLITPQPAEGRPESLLVADQLAALVKKAAKPAAARPSARAAASPREPAGLD